MTEEQIFAKATGMDPAERAGYLDKMCTNDPDLRSRLDGLIAAHENPDSFLSPPDPGPPPTEECTPIAESPGTIIGKYKLLEKIDEGGMGVVFVAERSKPYRQKVALKIIKPGMDSKSVIARFQAEQQTLALMDHPNIARVSDAYVAQACACGRREEALAFVSVLKRSLPVSEAFVYAEEPDRRRLFVERLVGELEGAPSNHQRMKIVHALLYLGEPSKATAASKDILVDADIGSYLGWETPYALLRGDQTVEDALRTCGKSRLKQTRAFWLIGLKYFAEGDRNEAEKAFNACVELGQINGSMYYAARITRDRWFVVYFLSLYPSMRALTH